MDKDEGKDTGGLVHQSFVHGRSQRSSKENHTGLGELHDCFDGTVVFFTGKASGNVGSPAFFLGSDAGRHGRRRRKARSSQRPGLRLFKGFVRMRRRAVRDAVFCRRKCQHLATTEGIPHGTLPDGRIFGRLFTLRKIEKVCFFVEKMSVIDGKGGI